MNEYTCRCGFKTNDINLLCKHIFTECRIEHVDINDEIKRYEYYRELVWFAFEDVLKIIAEGTFEIKGCNTDEFRTFWILLFVGVIEDKLFNVTTEMAQMLILEYAPDIAIMEYVGIVKVAVKNNKLIVEKSNK